MDLRRLARLSDMSFDQGFLSRRVRVLSDTPHVLIPSDTNELPPVQVRASARAAAALGY